MFRRAWLVLFSLCSTCPAGLAQWDPANGQWGKEDPRDVRVMTWNVLDAVCSTNSKVEGLNNWTSVARIIAAMKPDVLLLQETGDNQGNGTGSTVDSVSALSVTVHLLYNGGNDPFNGNTPITSWVGKYDPDYNIEHTFVSTMTDGFNRNTLISRYPFTDLNGDGKAVISDIFVVLADEYAPGGTGGIRGFQFAELDLPDEDYAGDLVVANAHLKAGGGSDNHQQRIAAAQNVVYFIDYLLNGAGTGIPDPNNRILDNPPVTSILGDHTPVIYGGDWNEDEANNGTKGPADWLVRAQFTGGTDGADRDRTDAMFDDAREPFSNDRETWCSNGGSCSKLDYVAWQDSIAVLRRAFIFDSQQVPSQAMPPELADMTFGGTFASMLASDHFPIIADFTLPLLSGSECPADLGDDGSVGPADLAVMLGTWGPCPGCAADLDGDGSVGPADLAILLGNWGECP